ncbi:MAG: TolC family protein [Candidatus Omnitrophica bacterium]|nr:TolC family protein [Candidatus Omnitrophota bacterium]
MRIEKRFYFVIFVFIAFFLTLAASADEILTWQGCLREAKQNNPDLVSARENLRYLQASRSIAASAALPHISTEINGASSKTAATSSKETYSYSLTGKQLLFDGSKTSFDIKAAEEEIRSAQFNYAAVSSEVRNRLRVAFVQLLKAQELLQLTQEIFERRKQNFELVQLRYDAGREHKGSLLTAAADFAQAEFEVIQAKRNLSLAQRSLIKELARTEFSPISVEGSLDLTDTSREVPNFEALAAETPFLKDLIAKREKAKFNLKSSKAEFFPKINFNASAGQTSSNWPPRDEYWSTGVTVSLPLFEGGSRLAEMKGAAALLRKADADAQSGRDSVVLALEQDWTSWQDAVDEVLVKRKFLEAAQERSKIAEAQYSNGLLSFDNWTIIEDNLVNTKKTFLDAQEQAFIAEANWVLTRGGALDEEE